MIGELLDVRECDLLREDGVVAGDVCLRIMRSMLELPVHPKPKRCEVNAAQVDFDLVTRASLLVVVFVSSVPSPRR